MIIRRQHLGCNNITNMELEKLILPSLCLIFVSVYDIEVSANKFNQSIVTSSRLHFTHGY